MRQWVIWNALKNEWGNCSWSVDDGILTVVTADGRKSTQLGDLSPEGLTRILMRELVIERQDVPNDHNLFAIREMLISNPAIKFAIGMALVPVT
jgi:hypothetical protein